VSAQDESTAARRNPEPASPIRSSGAADSYGRSDNRGDARVAVSKEPLHKLAHYGRYFPLHSDGLLVPLLKCSLAASRGLRALFELKRRFLEMQINWIELASLC
jgi:hypothetical protein